ncbi:MAG: TOBE domain-containing protein, partial [Deltaproteobacteria bacterium]|nr:TOBE domain-containing protein [Deltaproteobacteria bacterium]
MALKRVQESTGATFLMVTHDFAEALSLANRGAVLNQGVVEQAGDIDDIFLRPTSTFVADFVGMKNVFPAVFAGERTVVGGVEIRLGTRPGNNCGHIAIRPEDVKILVESPSEEGGNAFPGKVRGIVDQGFTYEVLVVVGDLTFRSLMTKKALFKKDIREGNPVFVSFPSDAVHCF